MKELIKAAEELYKQIGKAQVHLINARLNNDEEGKKSAISEMETAMCNAMQLLKCFIERKDNIVEMSMGIGTESGKEEWGAEPNKHYFIIQLGERIE